MRDQGPGTARNGGGSTDRGNPMGDVEGGQRRVLFPNPEPSISVVPNVSMAMMNHPSKLLNHFLWTKLGNKYPSARVVITEDTDWISVLRDSDSTLPDTEELYKRITEREAEMVENPNDEFLTWSFVAEGDSRGQTTALTSEALYQEDELQNFDREDSMEVESEEAKTPTTHYQQQNSDNFLDQSQQAAQQEADLSNILPTPMSIPFASRRNASNNVLLHKDPGESSTSLKANDPGPSSLIKSAEEQIASMDNAIDWVAARSLTVLLPEHSGGTVVSTDLLPVTPTSSVSSSSKRPAL
ncbi:hypothetical protein CPC08DRAFT_379031 [Agrocybe pediades]|nr:hypothetical protein CPC08DRAFT_379031 [Agrocybe pediades]